MVAENKHASGVWEKQFLPMIANRVSNLSKIVKSIKTLFEFVAKLFNLDDTVILSYLTLIAKEKNLMKIGTLSLISIGVPFLMNAKSTILCLN